MFILAGGPVSFCHIPLGRFTQPLCNMRQLTNCVVLLLCNVDKYINYIKDEGIYMCIYWSGVYARPGLLLSGGRGSWFGFHPPGGV